MSKVFFVCVTFVQLGFKRAHSEQAVIAHTCHGHTHHLSTGLSA